MKTTDIGFEKFPEDFVADPTTAFIKEQSICGRGQRTKAGVFDDACIHYDETLIDKLNQALCNHYTREEIMAIIDKIVGKD